jgi:biopolymer transport protein ExbB
MNLVRRLPPALILLVTAALSASLAAQTDPSPGAVAAPSQSLWDLLAQGGWAMWPLGACSLILFYLIFHTWRETRPARFVAPGLVPQLTPALAARDVPTAQQALASSPTVLARALAFALQRARPAHPDANKAHVEAALAEAIELEDHAVGQWINYLNVVATVAPMIGLLGTVSGMIGAFQTISLGGMGRPELLAGDIGEALITTATGLVIGIPAMVAYFVMRNRLANQIVATAQTGATLVDTLAGELPQED